VTIIKVGVRGVFQQLAPTAMVVPCLQLMATGLLSQLINCKVPGAIKMKGIKDALPGNRKRLAEAKVICIRLGEPQGSNGADLSVDPDVEGRTILGSGDPTALITGPNMQVLLELANLRSISLFIKRDNAESVAEYLEDLVSDVERRIGELEQRATENHVATGTSAPFVILSSIYSLLCQLVSSPRAHHDDQARALFKALVGYCLCVTKAPCALWPCGKSWSEQTVVLRPPRSNRVRSVENGAWTS